MRVAAWTSMLPRGAATSYPGLCVKPSRLGVAPVTTGHQRSLGARREGDAPGAAGSRPLHAWAVTG